MSTTPDETAGAAQPADGSQRRIGVYICHCGGNISDYVDVDAVREALKDEPGVVVSESPVFACSDGTQHDMIDAIKDQKLDGLVVASCSPKLHQVTFRNVAKRADLNQYAYTQVNVREQDSWAHPHDPEGATAKAIGLVRAGVAKTRLSDALEPAHRPDRAAGSGHRRWRRRAFGPRSGWPTSASRSCSSSARTSWEAGSARSGRPSRTTCPAPRRSPAWSRRSRPAETSPSTPGPSSRGSRAASATTTSR